MARVKYTNFSFDKDNFAKGTVGLYAESAAFQAKRAELLFKIHTSKYGESPIFYSSPGRIEIIGNHTDHNHGKVLCAAISLDTLAAVSPTKDNKVEIYSKGYPPVAADLADCNIKEEEKGTSTALVRGVAKAFTCRGYKVGGFAATTVSNIFKGAGVSSSAAFELLVAEVFNDLYNNGKVSPLEKAVCSQYAENNYFGKPSGLMDQCAIAFGGASWIDFKRLDNPTIKKTKWLFNDLAIVIVNCGGDHANLTPHYAGIKEDMEKIALHFGTSTLRAVNKQEFAANIKQLANLYSERAVLRAIHFFEENARVDAARQAMARADKDTFCALINQSGDSSYKLLQNCYPAGEARQPIPLALALCSQLAGIRACRVHGGGFAGTILNFVDKEKEHIFIKKAHKLFGKDNVFALQIRDKGTCRLEV